VAVYPPIDSLMPLDPACVLNSIDCGKEASLYVHVAFCETRCTFCHYAVRHYGGKGNGTRTDDDEVEHYLDALKQELWFWGTMLARSSTALSSIYIGGGTPLILGQEALRDIIRAIKMQFDVLPGAEVCIEGSPLTITAPGGEDKLRFLQQEGVTRLSFGVQSFDDTVLKYAARGYKRDIPLRACTIADRVFENWNLDLIQGLYKGSPLETWENLRVIAEMRPAHLTWYHGRFADRPQGDWYKMGSKSCDFEDEYATLFGRMLIWQELAALGYHQSDGNRFMREKRYSDPFKNVRTSASSSLIGIGAASYSHAGSKPTNSDCHAYMFRNETDVRHYVDRVLSGAPPIATGRIINEEELFAASYATGLRNGRREDDQLRSIRNRKPRLAAHYQALENQLREIRVLEPYDRGSVKPGLRISELGKLFEDEVLALFFSPMVKQALAMKASRGSQTAGVVPRDTLSCAV